MGIAGLPRAVPSPVLQQAQLHPANLGVCLWGAEPTAKGCVWVIPPASLGTAGVPCPVHLPLALLCDAVNPKQTWGLEPLLFPRLLSVLASHSAVV